MQIFVFPATVQATIIFSFLIINKMLDSCMLSQNTCCVHRIHLLTIFLKVTLKPLLLCIMFCQGYLNIPYNLGNICSRFIIFFLIAFFFCLMQVFLWTTLEWNGPYIIVFIATSHSSLFLSQTGNCRELLYSLLDCYINCFL